MAAAYGYAGEFSSDDDEKIEQYQERMVQTKFDNTMRPNKKQIEEEIEAIRRLPYDQELILSDDILAGLLDYYKTQRGPIVDSTRKLYNKIALRLVRSDQQNIVGGDGFAKETSNGNLQSKLVTDNNNSINLISKGPSQLSAADTFSSDDDDVEIVETDNRSKKLDSQVVYDDVNVVVDDDNMDVDSETPTGPVRETKQVELSTTDEDEDESSSESSDVNDSDEELNSGSDAIEVTPIKPPASARREKEAIEVLMTMRPNTPKQAEGALKKNQMAHSTPKESISGTAKKPYTRSQRIATRSATRSTRSKETMSKVDSKGTSSTSSDVFLQTRRVSRRNLSVVGGALVVLLLAFLCYYFRSSIMNTAEPLLRKKISF